MDALTPNAAVQVERTDRQDSSAPTAQHTHLVQLYSDDNLLLDMLSRFIGGAVAAGDAAVVIATRAHLEGLADRLRERGLDSTLAINKGRYILINAEELLPQLMANGQVSESRFNAIIGDVLTRARRAAESKDSRIAIFGELVALLWARGKSEEALRVEELWNGLAKHHYFSLLCAYPMTGFENDRQIEPFLKMCAQHSGIVPSESYTGLSSAEERLRTVADLQQKTQALEHALQLRQSEEKFRLLVEAVKDYAIFMLDPAGRIVSWNAGAQRIKGYNAAEIIGRHFSIFYPQDDLRNGKPDLELIVAAREGRLEDEGWRLRKDGSRFWASVIITAIRDESGELIGFGKVTRDVTERMKAQEKLHEEVRERREAERLLHESENSLRQLSRRLLRTQDEERRRIGRELHDSLGQSLVAMKINLESLAQLASTDNAAAARIAECVELVDSSTKEVRTISYLLYPPMLEEMGLRSAIPWYLEGFSARSGIRTTFEIGTEFERLSRDGELALFRILQESLTNIHRHSQSETAQIRLTRERGGTILEIKDSGKGMEQRSFEQIDPDWTGAHGVGLRGMYERMLQLGGSLEMSSDGTGTMVRAVIPADECEWKTPKAS